MHIGIDQYGSSRYQFQYQYMFMAIDNDTDIFILPIFGRYLSFWQIYWSIPIIFNRYLADTDIADIFLADTNTDMADTNIQFADTDISVSANYIGTPISVYP